MKISNHILDVLMVKLAGLTFFVLALIQLPLLLSSLVKLVGSLGVNQHLDVATPGGALAARYNQVLIYDSLGTIVAFIAYIIISKWLFGYPDILKKAFHLSLDKIETHEKEDLQKTNYLPRK